jgi:hypothetical protein
MPSKRRKRMDPSHPIVGLNLKKEALKLNRAGKPSSSAVKVFKRDGFVQCSLCEIAKPVRSSSTRRGLFM